MLAIISFTFSKWFKSSSNTESLDDKDTKDDKNYVMSLIKDIRKHGFTKLAPEDGHCCNGLWRKYEG